MKSRTLAYFKFVWHDLSLLLALLLALLLLLLLLSLLLLLLQLLVFVSVVVVVVAAVVCQTLRLLPVTLDFYLWVTLQLGSRSRRWPSKCVCVPVCVAVCV